MENQPDILTQAIEDTLEFVSYAAHRGIPLKVEDIANVVEAKRAGNAITGAKEEAFWASAALISKAITPVTIESLRSSTNTDEKDPASGAYAARLYRTRTAFTLAALLIFQIYWLIGITVTTDIIEIKQRLTTMASQWAKQAHQPKLKEGDPKKISSDVERRTFDTQLQMERISLATDFQILKNWNFAKNLLLWFQSPKPPGATVAPSSASGTSHADDDAITKDSYALWEFNMDNLAELQTAQVALAALLKYILPILYGALGASAYIVRSLEAEIKGHMYSSTSSVRYRLRFYLGAMAGLSIAWFTSDIKLTEASVQSLSPLALAFLAGYSVELLFSLLDRIVVAFSSAEPVKVRS